MTKKSTTALCHPPIKVPKHRSKYAHLKWLARPRMGLITPKYFAPKYECYCEKDPCIKRIRSTSERLRELAQPFNRNVTKKYTNPNPKELLKCTCDPPTFTKTSSRLDQLALPYVRNLLDTKTVAKAYMKRERINVFNQHIEKSLRTVYNNLANVKMTIPERKKKFTPQDWVRFNNWQAIRALPKRIFCDGYCSCMKEKPRGKIDFERVDTLSKPRWPVKPYNYTSPKVSDPLRPIPKSALNFEMTPRYEQLTKPFNPPFEEPFMEVYENPYTQPRDVANVKSLGIKALSEPRFKTKRFAKGDNNSVRFAVSMNAMKAKPTEHVLNLSKPRTNMGEGPRDNPFAVSRSALNPLKKAKLEYYTNLSKPLTRD